MSRSLTRIVIRTAAIAAIGSASIATLPTRALAQDATDFEMSEFKFNGNIVAENVYVRSGAGENDYPTSMLSKGQTVTVVGKQGDWLKIIPPQGSYCLVGKLWVDRRGDGTIGRVREDSSNVNVRVGSTLNNMNVKLVAQLKGGDDVKIVGDVDSYYKIEPPATVFLYVHKKFVEPGERVNVVSNNGALEVKPFGNGGTVPEKLAEKPAEKTVEPLKLDTPSPVPVNQIDNSIAPDPAKLAGSDAGKTTPATQPAVAQLSPTATFDALEARFATASAQPIDQQPIDTLLTDYRAVLDQKKLPESMLRVADYRAKGLQTRKDLLASYQEARKMQAAVAPKQQALKAEGDEIAVRLEQNRVKSFAAVGTLRASALMQAGRPLYRLTDPASGRTVVYLTADANLIQSEGQFVGIRGTLKDDAARQIKVITPTAIETISEAAVARGDISSPLTPPSLLPVAASAQ